MFIRAFSHFFILVFFVGLSLISIATTAQESVAETTDMQVANFRQCLVGLQQGAVKDGVLSSTIEQVLAKAQYLPKILEYDRNQPEFVQTFPGYFSKRVNSWRINKGREMLTKHQAFLAKLTLQYGIPAQYLVAFWGLETNFGSYKGKMPIIDSLATLACDERRSQFFTTELFQALRLLERENLQVEQMVGSWAGAMGHTQFMPTAYLTYAVDGDNDGKKDLWNSELDALASAANFLHNLGWKRGYRWGREVSLPVNFDYQIAGKSNKQALSYWRKQGLTTVSGIALENIPLKAALLVPAGHTGPAFLVYENFEVILRWNNSEYYGIAVGHLADRIMGKAPLSKALPDLPVYTIAQMQAFQQKLNELGFDVGTADGILGPATREGVRAFQASKQLVADGYPSQETFNLVVN